MSELQKELNRLNDAYNTHNFGIEPISRLAVQQARNLLIEVKNILLHFDDLNGNYCKSKSCGQCIYCILNHAVICDHIQPHGKEEA